MENQKTNILNPTPAQIAGFKTEWSAKGKNVHKLVVGDKVGYIHDPDRKTLSLAMTRIAKNDIIGGVEAILANCWIAGDETIKTDDRYFMGAAGIVDKLIQAETATLEKL